MKKLIGLSFLFLLLISCKKEKQASIVGTWREVSVYYQDGQGNYKWNDVANGFPYILSLRDDGTYSGFQCMPTGRGVYQYDHASKKISMRDISSGITDIYSVSALGDDYLILDYGTTSMGEYRVKFIRNQY